MTGPVSDSVPIPARHKWSPPLWVWGLLALAAGTIVVVQTTDLLDHAIANVLSFALTVLAAVVLLAWFSLSRRYPKWLRMTTLVGTLAVVGTMLGLFRVEHLSGEMIPTLALRWSPKADRRLASPERPAAQPTGPVARVEAGDIARRKQIAAEIGAPTEFDFPRFLGPDCGEAAPHVRLARDWTARPPRLCWRHEIGAGWSAFAVVHGHAVTMEQRGDQEMVTCYGVRGGECQWSHAIAARYDTVSGGVGPRSTPALADGRVYAQGATGRLLCLDGATGKLLWEKNLLEEYGVSPEEEASQLPWGRSGSPLVVDDLVIVPAGGRKDGRRVSLVAYDKRRGTRIWEGGGQQISYSSPSLATLAEVRQVLILNEATASGHDVRNGRVLWEHPWPARSYNQPNVSQAVAVAPNRVFLSKGYGRGAALVELSPRDDGTFATREVWHESTVMRTKFSNVTLKDGCAYGLSDGTLECIDLASGRRNWKEGRYQHGQILRVDDLLLVLSERGEVVLVEARADRANQVLGRFPALEGPTWNNLALSGPYLLVRNSQEAACYELPLQ
jgi:outer membrane protein assembly factor BamB